MDKSAKAPTIQMVSIDGIELRVGHSGEAGDASVPLLIFNGIGANLELFFPLMERLAPKRCIIFDAPGAGGSPLSATPMRFKALAALSAKLLDYFEEDVVDVIGVSWGGALAQEFAFRQMRRCRRLILAATSPGAVMVPGKLSVLLKLSNPKRYFKQHYLKSHAADIYGGMFRHDPALVEAYSTQVMSSQSKLGYYWQLFAIVGWTSFHWLHQLPQPTLVLVGKDDPIVPPINGRILHMRIPNSRLVEIDCGHLFLFSRMEEVCEIILEFLNREQSD